MRLEVRAQSLELNLDGAALGLTIEEIERWLEGGETASVEQGGRHIHDELSD